MDKTAELIKIDNMLHELEMKIAQNQTAADLQRVLQIKDPTTLKTELAKFDPAVLQALLVEINKIEIPNTLTEKQKTVVRTGTVKSGPNAGKRVIEYSDGTREFQ